MRSLQIASKKVKTMMKEKISELLRQANNVLLGKEEEVELAVSCLLSGGHLLIEDVPGVGKTTLVYLLGKLMGLKLNRIQFTNDLLPGDILGTMIYKREKEEFEFKKGPIFGELILADELNRATPKTQSALLQVMEERLVSVEGREFPLEYPFLIVATQNPFFQVGTFQLPESQLDRFHMSLHLNFPEREFEKKILRQGNSRDLIAKVPQVFEKEELREIRQKIEDITVEEPLLDYLLDFIEKGRSDFEEGVYLSPRAAKDLLQGAKAYSFIKGREYVMPEDIQRVAPYVLGHRLGGSKGVVHGQRIVRELISKVPVVS